MRRRPVQNLSLKGRDLIEKKIMLTNSELINHMENKIITFDKMSKLDDLYLLNNM
ncbi:hypothetical protein [Ligilactobacillus salivarius]|uniref:hypothetical protein n=1 Tax=Ligilactobacillus salivarius TaxID=1624 RepID=UPI00136812F6|nr:hypothetical protein [Ligilactobacillus salivarius]